MISTSNSLSQRFCIANHAAWAGGTGWKPVLRLRQRADELQEFFPLFFEKVQRHVAKLDVVRRLAVRLVGSPGDVVLRFGEDGGFDVGLRGHKKLQDSNVKMAGGHSLMNAASTFFKAMRLAPECA